MGLAVATGRSGDGLCAGTGVGAGGGAILTAAAAMLAVCVKSNPWLMGPWLLGGE